MLFTNLCHLVMSCLNMSGERYERRGFLVESVKKSLRKYSLGSGQSLFEAGQHRFLEKS
jgi:hypothetical protein